MLRSLELVTTSRDFILAFYGFYHGFQVKHLPFEEPAQYLVGVLHLRVEVIQSIFEMPLFFIFKQNELVCIFLLSKANIWHFHGVETTPFQSLFPILFKYLYMACKNVTLILIEVFVKILVAAPFGIEVLLHFEYLVFELFQEL